MPGVGRACDALPGEWVVAVTYRVRQPGPPAGDDVLDAILRRLARQPPAPRLTRVLTRTHQPVPVLGGEAKAQAVAHAGSVEVLIEDSRR